MEPHDAHSTSMVLTVTLRPSLPDQSTTTSVTTRAKTHIAPAQEVAADAQPTRDPHNSDRPGVVQKMMAPGQARTTKGANRQLADNKGWHQAPQQNYTTSE